MSSKSWIMASWFPNAEWLFRLLDCLRDEEPKRVYGFKRFVRFYLEISMTQSVPYLFDWLIISSISRLSGYGRSGMDGARCIGVWVCACDDEGGSIHRRANANQIQSHSTFLCVISIWLLNNWWPVRADGRRMTSLKVVSVAASCLSITRSPKTMPLRCIAMSKTS